jgi:hypothetical protein
MSRFVAFSILLGSLALVACSADAQDPGGSEDEIKKSGTVGAPCGGIAGLTCREGLRCNKANHPDAMGKCEAPAEQTFEGELTSIAGIGGESTGFAIDDKRAGMTELVLDAKEKRAFVEGRVARVHGKQTTLSGVESGPRTAVEVSRLTVCPAANASVNCMPPVQPGNSLCGEDRDWADKNCSGIRFLD